jgi:biopolymer transport protein ExbD
MGGGGSSSDDDLISGINVTPLVDVTLVLLIIFIVTARIIVTQSLPMDLPKAATGSETQTVFSVELGASGEVVVDSKRVPSEDAILPLAREARAKNPELRAVIRADSAVQHGRVIRVMDLLKQGGVSKVAFGVSPTSAEVGAVPAAPAPAASNLPLLVKDDTGRSRPPHLFLCPFPAP